jgi:hypothetical protein
MQAETKHRTGFTSSDQRSTIDRLIGERKSPVIPAPWPLHQQAVEGVDGERADSLQDIGHGRSTRAGIPIIIDQIRKQAGETRSGSILNKNIAMIGIPADGGKNDRNSLATEIPAGALEEKLLFTTIPVPGS